MHPTGAGIFLHLDCSQKFFPWLDISIGILLCYHVSEDLIPKFSQQGPRNFHDVLLDRVICFISCNIQMHFICGIFSHKTSDFIPDLFTLRFSFDVAAKYGAILINDWITA